VKPFLAGALLLTLVPQSAPPPAQHRTAGATALLVGHDAAQAQPLLQQALQDPDPSVRIIAARVAAMMPAPDLATELRSDLARETDAAVAVEDIRDVLLLAGSPAKADIDQQVRRNGPDAAVAYAEWLGRVRPEDLIARMSVLFAQAPDAGFDFTRIVRTSGDLHPNLRDDLYLAWMKVADATAWRSLLYQAYGRPGTAATGARVLTAALNSARPDIRTETVWFVVGHKDVPDAVLDAALPRSAAAVVDWETFGRELIARRFKHQQTPDRAEFLKSALANPVFGASDLRVNPDVTAAEQAMLKAVPMGGRQALDPSLPASGFTVVAAARGEIESVLESAGCDAKAEHFGVAAIAYADDGRPKKIVVAQGLPSGCQLALTTLARLELEPRAHAATDGALMFVLPFDKDVVRCLDEAPEQAQFLVPPRVDRRRVQPPEKVRNADIYYPPEAQKQGLQGTVMVEAVIAPRGCVEHARIVGGRSPLLDAAALDFVMRTPYKPPLVDGKPGAVAMTVPVTFTMSK
jgi:TonB family protein